MHVHSRWTSSSASTNCDARQQVHVENEEMFFGTDSPEPMDTLKYIAIRKRHYNSDGVAFMHRQL